VKVFSPATPHVTEGDCVKVKLTLLILGESMEGRGALQSTPLRDTSRENVEVIDSAGIEGVVHSSREEDSTVAGATAGIDGA